jgi:hypothetical protein
MPDLIEEREREREWESLRRESIGLIEEHV